MPDYQETLLNFLRGSGGNPSQLPGWNDAITGALQSSYPPQDVQSMTHQPQQPNPAAPILDALKEMNPFGGHGVSQILKGQGIQLPDWSNTIGKVLQSDAANTAIGMATPFKAGLGDVLPRNLGVARPDRPINLETLHEMQQAPPEALPSGRQVNEQTLAEMRAAQSPPSITAFHGSPHDFDKFDLSKIGTGEGAQSYGHGLYFAENEGVARNYRDALQAKAPVAVDVPTEGGPKAILANAVREARKVPEPERLAAMHSWLDETIGMMGGKYAPPGGLESAVEAKRLLQSGEYKPDLGPAGKMYQVAIKADPEHFLDWDKPLSEQSEHVKEALRPLYEGVTTRPLGDKMVDIVTEARGHGTPNFVRSSTFGSVPKDQIPEDLVRWAMDHDPRSGQSILDRLGRENAVGDERRAAATEQLRQAGIPGVKYLDQGSRLPARANLNAEMYDVEQSIKSGDLGPGAAAAAEQKLKALRDEFNKSLKGTSNYVVFDDKMIDIIKKYGLAGLIGGGGASALGGQNGSATQ